MARGAQAGEAILSIPVIILAKLWPCCQAETGPLGQGFDVGVEIVLYLRMLSLYSYSYASLPRPVGRWAGDAGAWAGAEAGAGVGAGTEAEGPRRAGWGRALKDFRNDWPAGAGWFIVRSMDTAIAGAGLNPAHSNAVHCLTLDSENQLQILPAGASPMALLASSSSFTPAGASSCYCIALPLLASSCNGCSP